MKATGRYIESNYNRTLLTYTFANGSYIEFFSADQEDKVRGPRRNILYINECNNINFETYHQLAIRTSHEIWLDFNPSNEFWAYTELQDDPDTEWLTLTYKDNEALHENIVKEIEKAKIKAYYDPEGDIFDESNVKNTFWDNWWKVYGLGLLGSLEGVIFTNWRQIDSIPKEAVYVGSGLDFGFTNDPTSVVDIYEYGEYRILDERCYLTGLVNAQILPFLNKDGNTYADSAEPKSIAEINNLGYKKVYPTVKGKDSIVYGIQIMQGQKYLVTKRSTNLIKELRSYCWDKDKSGRALNKPVDAFNHCFVGETLITTINGDKPIEDIEVGELVLTRNGYKRVLKKFNNGIKKVIEQTMQFDTFSLSLVGTKDHKVWTQKKWEELSKLKKGNKVCVANHLKAKNIDYTQMKDISVEVEKDCIESFGNPITEKYQKGITFTTSTEIHQTTTSKTSESSIKNFILDTKEKREPETTMTGLRRLTTKEERQLKNGTLRKRVSNGTKNNGRILSEKSKQLKETAITVGNHIKQNTLQDQSSVTTIVSQRHEEKGLRTVYDIMVEDCHEYFANGLLVHNCIDAVRYHEMMTISKPKAWPTTF